ncbi:hypothetical protein RI844_09860 [Thalassotalea fonticola]|uniref:Protein BatD n=1 Tax=Thalassotalea fonticola TaxID=3065649 RepID=A0ABZ0GUN4_9GAMM|nr:hypothetical protein RI844_09860 [Colwelliaceae bacterium S1-1]
MVKVISIYVSRLFSVSRLLLLLVLIINSRVNAEVLQQTLNPANDVNSNANLNANEQLKATVHLSKKSLTPGQQLSLTIDIYYREGTDIFFDPTQYDWQPFSLVQHRKNAPQWLDKNQQSTDIENYQWQINHVIDLIAPIAGNYQLPTITLNSYWQHQHQALKVGLEEVSVLSSFSNVKTDVKLQPIQSFVSPANKVNSSAMFITYFAITTILSLAIFTIFLKQRRSRFKVQQQFNNHPRVLLPEELIAKVNNINKQGRGEYDWQGLRQCIQQQLGFDPMAEQDNQQNLALSKQYMSARFSSDHKASYINICEQIAITKGSQY